MLGQIVEAHSKEMGLIRARITAVRIDGKPAPHGVYMHTEETELVIEGAESSAARSRRVRSAPFPDPGPTELHPLTVCLPLHQLN